MKKEGITPLLSGLAGSPLAFERNKKLRGVY
jgi:hypothetical protein